MLKPVRLLALAAMLGMSAPTLADEIRPLFDGQTLTGWTGDPAVWSVKDGAITASTSEGQLKQNTFLIWNQGWVADFELTLSYKMVGGNSGIQYRSEVMDPEKFVVGGYQADIDSSPRYSGINYEERRRGILCERGQKVTISKTGEKQVEQVASAEELQKHIKSEDWNEYKIIAKGNHLQHFINGKLMAEVIDEQKEKATRSGVLALQAHTGPPMVVQFKNLKLKELK